MGGAVRREACASGPHCGWGPAGPSGGPVIGLGFYTWTAQILRDDWSKWRQISEALPGKMGTFLLTRRQSCYLCQYNSTIHKVVCVCVRGWTLPEMWISDQNLYYGCAALRTPQQEKKVNQHSDFIDNVRSTRSERGSSTGCGKTMRTTPKSSSCA